MADISDKYRSQLLRRELQYNREFKKIFDKIADDFARLANDPNMKFSKAFKFPASIEKKITAIIAEFHDQVLSLTEAEIITAWDLSNEKNDNIVNDFLKTIGKIKAAQEAAYLLPNIPALEAFLSSPHDTETLSDSIWKISKQFRTELETHLGIGVANGDSAQVISQRIRQYLQNPDALFRRVRDNNGRLVASKAMLENHPGQGVYNSAYKNALRVARTNVNQAYQLADYMRWQNLDMIKGIEIRLSAQHPDYPHEEICEELVGIYPKTFVFTGFHPQCLCIAIPILSSEEDFMSYLKTGQKEINGAISQYPENFKNFWKANYDKYSNYQTMPWIMEDNLKVIKNIVKKK